MTDDFLNDLKTLSDRTYSSIYKTCIILSILHTASIVDQTSEAKLLPETATLLQGDKVAFSYSFLTVSCC